MHLLSSVQFTQQGEGERAELPVDVLDAIYSHGPAENPAHVGFDGHADDLDILLRFDDCNDVSEMTCSKIADIAALLAHIRSARVSVGNDEHDPAFGSAFLQPFVTPHDGFPAVVEIVHPRVQDGAQSVYCCQIVRLLARLEDDVVHRAIAADDIRDDL